jgi:hypothetical protein
MRRKSVVLAALTDLRDSRFIRRVRLGSVMALVHRAMRRRSDAADLGSAMMNDAVKASRMFYVLSILVILTFLWRFLVPAHEESDTNLMIGFEILLEFAAPAGLVALFFVLMSRLGEDSRRLLVVTFCMALVASVGILVMRFSSTAGWHTGHRVYQPGYGSLDVPTRALL